MKARLPGAALAVVMALACAGCGGGAGDDRSGDSSPTTTQASVDPGRVSPQDLPSVPAVRHAKGAIADTTFGRCAATAGSEQVTGTVHNPTGSAADYAVTVSWTNATSDVLARAVVVLRHVAAGAKKDFVAKADVPSGATTCTFNVLRGTIR